ncbi:MAG: MBL fold metallo-hydrolase, partial [Actinobacteria bacterium]|nr:MBL fold metallo-hydrolase [Actinomycetota bacterium]
RAAFAAGDYRWVAELVNHLIFADPTHSEARALQADTLEQLGYQSESSTFRNSYLTGAMELRQGPPQLGSSQVRGRGLLVAMTIEQIFDTLAVRLISENVSGLSLKINWHFTDMSGTADERWLLGLSHRTLYSVQGRNDEKAQATLTMARSTLISIIIQETTFLDEIGKGSIVIDGDATALLTIFGNLDAFPNSFNIVEP